MPKTTLNDPREPAEICREHGWTVGTRLVGDEGRDHTIIEITALGEQQILAKTVSENGEWMTKTWEGAWSLSTRDWQVVPDPDSTPPPKTPQGDAEAPRAAVEAIVERYLALCDTKNADGSSCEDVERDLIEPIISLSINNLRQQMAIGPSNISGVIEP